MALSNSVLDRPDLRAPGKLIRCRRDKTSAAVNRKHTFHMLKFSLTIKLD